MTFLENRDILCPGRDTGHFSKNQDYPGKNLADGHPNSKGFHDRKKGNFDQNLQDRKNKNFEENFMGSEKVCHDKQKILKPH